MFGLSIIKRLPKKPLVGLAVLAVALVAAGAGARSAQAAPILTVTPTPHGTSIDFSVTSNTPVILEEFIVCESPLPVTQLPHYNCPGPIEFSTATYGTTVRTSWWFNIDVLRPGRTQYWAATTKDAAGVRAKTYGTTATLKRKVVIDFTYINVQGDSDSLGAGELTFYFNVNGTWHRGMDYGPKSIGSGAIVYPNRSLTLYNYKPDMISLMVEGVDDDCNVSTCSRLPDGSTGSNDDFDWATTDGRLFNVWRGEPATYPYESHSQSIELRTPYTRLRFTVIVKISVSHYA